MSSGFGRTENQSSPEPRVPSPEWDRMVLVGRIARPHGIRGHVIVTPDTDFVENRFQKGATFWTRSDRGDEELKVSTARVQNGRPVLGSWVVDGSAAGLGVRESDGPVTDYYARFVPHYIDAPTPGVEQRAAWLREDGIKP